jgi:hypothetical protein
MTRHCSSDTGWAETAQCKDAVPWIAEADCQVKRCFLLFQEGALNQSMAGRAWGKHGGFELSYASRSADILGANKLLAAQ